MGSTLPPAKSPFGRLTCISLRSPVLSVPSISHALDDYTAALQHSVLFDSWVTDYHSGLMEQEQGGESVAGVGEGFAVMRPGFPATRRRQMVTRSLANVNIKKHALSSPYIHIPTIDPKTEENDKDFCRLT